MSTRARVRITLDIPLSASWGDDCTLAQVKKQAKEDIQQLLRQNIGGGQIFPKGTTVIGTPKVEAIIEGDV